MFKTEIALPLWIYYDVLNAASENFQRNNL